MPTLLASCAVTLLMVSACSQTAPTAAPQRPSASTAAQTAPVTAPAETLRATALAATPALHSYLFSSTSVVNGAQVLVQGRSILPNRLALSFVSAAHHDQMVRIGATTYVKTGSRPWAHSSHPSPTSSPLAGLLLALSASTSLTVDDAGQLVGQLSAADAAASGLVRAGSAVKPISVMFAVDGAGHVTSFTVQTTLIAGGHQVSLRQVTTYASFDNVPPVSAP